jgi:hypothetical protein
VPLDCQRHGSGVYYALFARTTPNVTGVACGFVYFFTEFTSSCISGERGRGRIDP